MPLEFQLIDSKKAKKLANVYRLKLSWIIGRWNHYLDFFTKTLGIPGLKLDAYF